MSSLSAQLAARQTLDSSRLATAASLKHPPSFIYSPRHAATITTITLHSLACNAWDQLSAIDPFFEKFQQRILGEEAKRTDRSALTKEENEKLDKVLEKVMRAMGKHMLLKPTGVVLEWLIRRFRVNDLNVPALIALFLPYHTTPHFPSALTLISVPTLASTHFSALIPTQTSLAPLPLPALISLLPPFSKVSTSRSLLDFILALPLSYLTQGEVVHRALISFWLQVLAGYLERAGSALKEGEQVAVLSTLLETVQGARSQPDVLIASYILLTRYALHYPLDGEKLRVVMKTLAINRPAKAVLGAGETDGETESALLNTLVVITGLAEEEVMVEDGKKFLGASGWKGLMKIDDLGATLVGLCGQYDARKFMNPFLATLATESLENATPLALLSSLLTPILSPTSDEQIFLPQGIISLLTSHLLKTLLASPTSTNSPDLTQILSRVYQRYPAVWNQNTTALLKSVSEDVDKVTIVRTIVNKVLGGGGSLETSSPDLAIRILALQDLLGSTSLSPDEEQGEDGAEDSFVHDVLVARLSEPVVDVLSIVLGEAGQAKLHAAVEPEVIMSTLERVLLAKVQGVEVLVLEYLSNGFLNAFEDKREEVIKRFWWNRLLHSKASAAAKQTIDISATSLHTFSWVQGIIKEDTNELLVGKIAKNIANLEAEARGSVLAYMLTLIKVSDEETKEDGQAGAGGRLLTLLVSAQVVRLLDAAPRASYIVDILSALRLESRGIDHISSIQPESILEEGTGSLSPLLVGAIYNKSFFYNTLRRCRAALVLSAVAATGKMEGTSWSWLAKKALPPSSELLSSIYRLAHTSTTPGSLNLSSKILQSLFTHSITDDSLAFFTSIWITSPSIELKVIALRDATDYIRASQSIVTKNVDYQIILPALVIALGDVDKRVRLAALECLRVYGSGIKAGNTEVYGKDLFYGKSASGALKYLDIVDSTRYVTKLLESHIEFTMDGAYTVTFHASILSADDAEGAKKKSSLKTKVFQLLLSHTSAWQCISARVGLLRAVSGIIDGVKSTLVIPILHEVVKSGEKDRSAAMDGEKAETINEYANLLVGPFEGVSRKWMENAENGGMETFCAALEILDITGIGATLRKNALLIARSSLFSTLKGEYRLDVFRRLVRLASSTDSRLTADVSECLRACKVDLETVAGLLTDIRTSIATPISKAAKRGRTSQGVASSRSERIPELVVVLETVDFSTITPSHTLVITLFDLLSTVIEISTSAQIDIQYVGQLLLATLSKVIENVTPSSGITGDSIRMAPVLDLMRSSINPQTSHQALLLLAQLGPLVPDQLVHNIMPIFTFMGANVLQRDDAYSLRVVDRTLESIVPALVDSMKQSSANRDTLVLGLKKLLRVFTDAATHVPRHRRIKLFVRFVETLGALDFLSAVSMLLVDKAVKAVDPTSLPLSLFESFSVGTQLLAFKQIVEEISRLLCAGAQESVVTFLDRPTDSLDAAQNAEAAKGQVLNIVNFLAISLETKQLSGKVDAARAAGQHEVDTSLTEIVRSLLDISTMPLAEYTASDKAELTTATGYALQAAVHLMSTQSFSEALLWLLDLEDLTIQASALALLCNRLPTIKAVRRGDISPAVVNVVERIRLSLADPTSNTEDALATLDVIATSVWAEEDAVLAKAVPDLLVVANASSTASKATKALAMGIVKQLANRLGPRLIPLAAKITPFAVEILRSEARDPSVNSSIVCSAFEILEGLFTSIPTFIGSQLDKVLEACLSTDILSLTELFEGPASKARAALLSTAAKKVPAKSLYPSIIRLHASVDLTTKEPILGLLDVLNRALRQGKTTDIAENYRPVFKLFLSVFDLRRLRPATLDLEDINQIEENALGAFVQFILKLNEQTFRPLFLRTYDWAVIDLATDAEDSHEALTARRIVLYKLIDRLLTQLKAIVVPYFSFMLDQTSELLESFTRGETKDASLWTSITSALTKALVFDETGFWTPLRLSKLSTPIARQLESGFSATLVASHLHPLITAYSVALLPHEIHLKNFNSSILMLTRSDDLKVKRGALEALEQMWDALGDSMIGLVPETTPFLSETLEEVDGGVEMVTRRLVAKIEGFLGESLADFLEN